MTRSAALLLPALALIGACREYHEDPAFLECQPYALQCATCSFDDDRADATDLQRVYQCEGADGTRYDAVQRRSADADADDTHFYDPADGLREAALRRYDQSIDVCGRDLRDEWYGLILDDCVPVCEHDDHDDSDETLPSCDAASSR